MKGFQYDSWNKCKIHLVASLCGIAKAAESRVVRFRFVVDWNSGCAEYKIGG